MNSLGNGKEEVQKAGQVSVTEGKQWRNNHKTQLGSAELLKNRYARITYTLLSVQSVLVVDYRGNVKIMLPEQALARGG